MVFIERMSELGMIFSVVIVAAEQIIYRWVG